MRGTSNISSSGAACSSSLKFQVSTDIFHVSTDICFTSTARFNWHWCNNWLLFHLTIKGYLRGDFTHFSEGNNTVWTERSLKFSPSHKVVENTWVGKWQLQALINWGRTYEFIGKMEFTGELPKTSQVGFTIHIQNEWLPVVTAWLAVYKESSG